MDFDQIASTEMQSDSIATVDVDVDVDDDTCVRAQYENRQVGIFFMF